MNKKQLINEIMDLYDENESLKNKLRNYENNKIKEIATNIEKEQAFKELDKKAKGKLFTEMIYEWHMPQVEVKEDSGDFNFLTFEQWLKTIKLDDAINSNYSYLFDSLTYSELKDYFYEQFKDYYNNLVNDKKMEIVRSKKNE